MFTASIVVGAGLEVRVSDAQFLGQPPVVQQQVLQGTPQQVSLQQQRLHQPRLPQTQPQTPPQAQLTQAQLPTAQLGHPQFQQRLAQRNSVLQGSALQSPMMQKPPAMQNPVVHVQRGQSFDLPVPAAAQQKPSWTQKVTGFFTGKSKKQSSNPTVPPVYSQVNPTDSSSQAGVASVEYCLSMAKQSEQSGNSTQARELYQRALSMQPGNLVGMLALARLEDREGQLDAALHYYLQAVKSSPQSPQALNDLSLCFARRGQLVEALQPLQDAIRLQPTKALYRNNIAKVLTELNRIDEASQHLSAVHPPAVAQYNIGVLLHQRGRDAEAVRYLTAATHIDPSLAAAGTLLAQLSTGPAGQIVQRVPAANDNILPTARAAATSSPYPTTGIGTATARYQNVPAETAQMPVGASPVLLPPVR